MGLFAGDAVISGVLSLVGVGGFLFWFSWLVGRGLLASSLGVLTASSSGAGLFAFSVTSCLGLGVLSLRVVSATRVFPALDAFAFVSIVLVLRGGLVMSHVPTNSPQGLLEERGIPGKIWPRSLLIGWVNPSRREGLWKEKEMSNNRSSSSLSS